MNATLVNRVRFTKRDEQWLTRHGLIRKVAVRDSKGRFHGATNFVQNANRR
jgi:hypothetical protein